MKYEKRGPRLMVTLAVFCDRTLVMHVFRRLVRDLQFAVLMACALALASLAGARMSGHHASKPHALAALHIICAENGLSVPADSGKNDNHTHSDCPFGPVCAFKTFGTISMAPIGPAWSIATDGEIIRMGRDAAPPPARAPPAVSARGPPTLI
jgi:hypothetical protein